MIGVWMWKIKRSMSSRVVNKHLQQRLLARLCKNNNHKSAWELQFEWYSGKEVSM